MERKVVTEYWPKPISTRKGDWCATFDGYEPGKPVGFGATEQEAIDALWLEAEDSGYLDFIKEQGK